MKQVKKLLCGMLMVCMIVAGITIVPQNVQAATASGNDGEIHWEIKGDTLTLSAVKGTKGRMNDNDAHQAPWYKYKVSSLVIKEGVTSLSEYAFLDYPIKYAIIPNSLTNIPLYAFNGIFGGNSLKKVYGYKNSAAETYVNTYNERVADANVIYNSNDDYETWKKLIKDYDDKWGVDPVQNPDDFLLYCYTMEDGGLSYDSKYAISFLSLNSNKCLSNVKISKSLCINRKDSSTIKCTLPTGFTKVTKYTGSPADVKVTFKSSNPKVATVSSSGKVTGKKKGTAKITVTMQIKAGAKKTVTTKVKVK